MHGARNLCTPAVVYIKYEKRNHMWLKLFNVCKQKSYAIISTYSVCFETKRKQFVTERLSLEQCRWTVKAVGLLTTYQLIQRHKTSTLCTLVFTLCSTKIKLQQFYTVRMRFACISIKTEITALHNVNGQDSVFTVRYEFNI